MKSIKIHPRYIPIFIEMSGLDLMYILKRLGIFLKNYGLMMNQPMNSDSVVNNSWTWTSSLVYRRRGQIEVRIF